MNIGKKWEKIGKICLQQRTLYIIVIIAAILQVSVFSHLLFNFKKLKEFNLRLDNLEKIAATSLDKRKAKQLFLKIHRSADPSYIDNNLIPLTFLHLEKKMLETALDALPFFQNIQLKKRLDFIKGPKNKLALIKEETRSSRLLKELEIKQLHPIEANEEDIQKILALIEGVSIDSYSPAPGRPQIIIQDFSLEKRKVNQQEIFILKMNLLQREFLKKG